MLTPLLATCSSAPRFLLKLLTSLTKQVLHGESIQHQQGSSAKSELQLSTASLVRWKDAALKCRWLQPCCSQVTGGKSQTRVPTSLETAQTGAELGFRSSGHPCQGPARGHERFSPSRLCQILKHHAALPAGPEKSASLQLVQFLPFAEKHGAFFII